MNKFDRCDLKILASLDTDARQSVSDLARSVRLGRDLVAYRLDRLLKEGAITGLRTIINPYLLGLGNYKTFLKLQCKPARIDALYRALKTHPQVYWAALTDGSWDVFFSCTVESPSRFWQIQQDILGPYQEIIIEREFSTNISFDIYSRGYFSNKERRIFALGAESWQFKISETDAHMLRILSESARIDSVELSDQCEVSPAAVRNRIREFEKSGIIAGYKIELNLEKFSRTLFKARIFAAGLLGSEQEKLEQHCRRIDEITYLVRQLGSCPIELTIEALDYRHFHQVMQGLNEKFSSTIQRVETLLMRDSFFKWCDPSTRSGQEPTGKI